MHFGLKKTRCKIQSWYCGSVRCSTKKICWECKNHFEFFIDTG